MASESVFEASGVLIDDHSCAHPYLDICSPVKPGVYDVGVMQKNSAMLLFELFDDFYSEVKEICGQIPSDDFVSLKKKCKGIVKIFRNMKLNVEE